MHQTFYVDIDEEVNSVISRIRKSNSQYNILAVAQQALILQSSVSLRLIKKEMDALNKKVMIVTQDERGLAMARKVGFPVKKSIEDVKKDQESAISQPMGITQNREAQEKSDVVMDSNDDSKTSLNNQNRLKNLGNSEFVAVDQMSIAGPIKKIDKKNNLKERDTSSFSFPKEEEKSFGDLFVERGTDKNLPEKNKNVSGGAGKFLWIFFILVSFLILGVSAYLFFPKADISIFPKKIEKKIILTIEASGNSPESTGRADVIKMKPVSVEAEDVLSISLDATGDKTASNKKARGKITIHNNFSEASQILVATTRFLSDDGKIFRLVSAVTVPGIKVENGEKTPGKIEAEVIADQPGEEYNIDATSFKIPGFEGSPKYDKFSAQSNEKMKGGGEGESELKTVSQADVDKAKKDATEKIKIKLAEKIKEKVGSENTFFGDSIEYEILDEASFPEVGSVADNFEYQLKAKAKYLTFSSSELEKKVNESVGKISSEQDFLVEVESVDKKFNNWKANFADGSVRAELGVNIIMVAKMDSDKIKQELLGKNQSQVDEFIGKHPEIRKIDASINPSFLASKIPRYSSRVEINIIKE